VIRQSSTRLCGQWIILVAALVAAPALAQDTQPKWGPHIDLEAKPGTKRSLGEADLFIPVAQSADTLLFANLRLRMDDNDSNEGNYGLGVRHMLDSGWNIGGYGYFDRRRTEFDNHFNQVTLGVEALSQDWDLRANYYAPVGRRSHNVDSLSTAEVSGTSVIFRGGEERSLGGFDAEIGWRVPLFDASADRQFRIFGGAYHFSESGVPDVTGPRARAELTFDSVPYLWEGSRFSIGAEWQHDDPRGSQGFLTARLRIPLQVYGKPSSQLTPMERRMADPIVRDIDVVSQAGQFSAPETATQLAGGGSFTVINSSSTSGAALPGAVTAAANNSTIILSGAFSTTVEINLAGNKSLMAGSMTVRSASGRTATLQTPATITGNTAGMNANAMILAPGGNTVSGLTLVGSGAIARGVLVNTGAGNVTISNNTISLTQTGAGGLVGVNLDTNSNVSVIGNSITLRGIGGATLTGLGTSSTTNLTVAGNTFDVTGGANNRMVNFTAGATITAASTGNVHVNGVCTGSPTSGSVGFTDGTACP
jgi:hypothetical protein